MNKSQNIKIRKEVREISDLDHPPQQCPQCESKEIRRKTYHIRTLQDMGDINTKRIVRYEEITWECKKCHVTFVVDHHLIKGGARYTDSVIDYAKYRVLEKGDSANRVAEDLNRLHHVKVSTKTILNWVNPEDANEKLPTEFKRVGEEERNLSEVLSIDGTFKSVKQKKNEIRRDTINASLLYLTRQEDGRLVVYWHEENPKKKSRKSGKK